MINKERIDDHFNIALYEIESGATLDELRDVIQSYQDIEDYEACAGIHRAVEMVSFLALTQVTKQLESNIELTFNEL